MSGLQVKTDGLEKEKKEWQVREVQLLDQESKQLLDIEHLKNQLSQVQGTAEESEAALRKELLEEQTKTESTLSDLATSKQQATQLESEVNDLRAATDKDSSTAGEEMIELKKVIEQLTEQRDATEVERQQLSEE
jgi:hypothetical protein